MCGGNKMKKEIIVKLTYDGDNSSQDNVFDLLNLGVKNSSLIDWELQ